MEITYKHSSGKTETLAVGKKVWCGRGQYVPGVICHVEKMGINVRITKAGYGYKVGDYEFLPPWLVSPRKEERHAKA